jgi:hypothetical protein
LGTLDSKQKPIGPERVANGIEKFKEYLYSTPKAMEIVKKQIEALVKKEQEGQ